MRGLKFENYRQPVVPFAVWLKRVARSFALSCGILGVALGIGIIGYHTLGHLSWIDSILEASMILGGMGAVAPMTDSAVKLFASAYALFSGFVALSSMAIILTPWLHRVMHHLHAVPDDDGEADKK